MTWPLWLLLVLCLLAVVAAGLRAYGAHQWYNATQTLSRRLEAARVDQKEPLRPQVRYDPRELEGLPAPVQRYFRAVLREGQPIVTAATIDLTGRFNLSTTDENWKPFTSRQRVEAGLISAARAEARGAMVGKRMVMIPWEGSWSDYEVHDGMKVPMRGEAAWLRPEGRKVYFAGAVTSVSYDFSLPP